MAGRSADLAALVDAAAGLRENGLLAQARTQYLEAAKAAEAAGDSDTLIATALGVGGIWVHEQREVVARAEAQALWDRALAATAPGSLDAARLEIRRAAEAVYEGAPLDPVVAAVEVIRTFDDDSALAEALSLLHHVQLGPRWAEVRLGIADEIVRRAAHSGDDLLALMGLCWRTVDLFLLGNPRARQSLTELHQRAAAKDIEALSFIADVLSAMLELRKGRFDMAESLSAAAFERGLAVGDPDANAYYGAMLATLRWWQGRPGEVIELVRAISSSPQLGYNDHVYVATDAVLSTQIGDVDAAEEALARLAAVGLEQLPDSSSWLTTNALAAEAAFVLGDEHTAEKVAGLLEPFAHLPVMPSLAVVCLGSAERALGLCTATTGRLDAAVHHLDAALVADQRLGNRPVAVLTEHTLAAILRRRAAPADEVRADQLERRAALRASRMGIALPREPDWFSSGPQSARSVEPNRVAQFERLSVGWRVVIGNQATILNDRVGLSYLAELLLRPREGVHVLSLVCGSMVEARGSSEPVLDEAALRAYRRRVRELTALLSDSHLNGPDRQRHNREFVSLTKEIRSSTGLGGRTRRFTDSAERARTAVRKALLRAVSDIEGAVPDLGRHLRASLTTGTTCSYTPQPGWMISIRTSGRNRSGEGTDDT